MDKQHTNQPKKSHGKKLGKLGQPGKINNPDQFRPNQSRPDQQQRPNQPGNFNNPNQSTWNQK